MHVIHDVTLSRAFLEWGPGWDGRALSCREGGRVIVSRLIWSMGFAGLALACAVANWLHRPVELPYQAAEPEASTPLAQAPTPRPRSVAPGPSTPVAPAQPDARPITRPTSASEAERSARSRRTPPAQRLRLVTALRGTHPSPEARRDAVLAELTASGESHEPWTAQARAALAKWHAQVEADVLPVQAEPPRCFAAGCVARVTFPDSDSFQESFRRTADLRLGEGTTHMQLPPERRASGEVVAAWLVLRPATP
ncbi:conserved hypothetical protein [Myxococcus xanthus DK 1622]|uniref:Uncharacterized protein n=1 Tax=Myxococcus xanthus (strain DK1622) TaxID=246197 RepID=Q1CXC0_MYXXD|nr:conserved hypothetical protein [Myxococcus xanthus DK 1622]NOJ51299.1 hypothetical protein [Myxococcus xanthus]QPM79132.1 hypothetical protein I5Q59_33665 [Myxococcus xanthus]QVW68210.1 hypothetical protein JTM82_01195 [Myxococcus xanthus DZ2]UEO05676.1 hypothetical protein K1515_03785 [Myxococcus xanthus DZ2]